MADPMTFVWLGLSLLIVGLLVWAFRPYFGKRRLLAKWGGLAVAAIGFICVFALGLTQIR